jgi:hypothetical protein
MAVTIVTRAGAGTQLTWNQVDANFTNLNSAVVIPGGTTGQVLAKNSGSDYDLTWTNVNVTPAGSNGQIQFNASGSFGSSSALSFSGSALTVGSTSVGNGALKLAGGTSGVVTLQPNATAGTWSLTLPTTAGTNNFVLTTDGTGITSWQPASASSGLILGTTAIAGGTSGRLLYDNAGVLGELATTGSGNVVLATSPTLTTPTLGVASATTINKVTITAPTTGATLTLADGSTLATSGAFSTTLTTTGTTTLTLPTSGTVTALGNSTTGSGNIVLATSPTLTTPVIGAATGTSLTVTGALTTTAGALTTGTQGTTQGSLVLTNTNSTFSTTVKSSNSSTAAWTLTLPTSAGSSGQYLQTDGSGTASWQTVATGLTIGTTATSGGAAGQIMFDTGSVLQESSGLVWDNTNKALSTLGGGTVTTSNPVINASQTWNASGTTFTGIKLNVTNTASAAASVLMDLQVGSASKFSVTPNGYLNFVGGNFAFLSNGSSVLNYGITRSGFFYGGSLLTNSFGFTSNGMYENSLTYQIINSNATVLAFNNATCVLSAPTAATWQLGSANAASPVAQTLSVQSVVAGTSNTAGQNFTIAGSQGTGTGVGGDIIFQVAPAGSSGTAQNALATALRVYNNKTVFVGAGFTVAGLPAAGTAGRRAYVTDALAPTFLGTLTGGGSVVTPVFDNGTAWVAG